MVQLVQFVQLAPITPSNSLTLKIPQVTEAFLQYLWQHRLFDEPLTTVDGLSVEVLRPGLLNTDAGPDFMDVRLRIDGCLWAGSVEVHLRSSDWNRHHHTSDYAYNGVLLHVVYQHDAEIRLPDGSVLPTLEVREVIPEMVWHNYETLLSPPSEMAVGCAGRITQVPSVVRRAALDSLSVERMQRKTQVVARMLDESRGNWEQCCYLLLAHYFGGRVNAFPFELMAKSIDMNLLARWRDDTQRLEALLFGQAGMLQEFFEDDYPRQLQADYQALRQGAGLKPISAHLWKFFRLRPSGFPTLRISQFAQLLGRSQSLFSRLLEMDRVEELRDCFDVAASDYWTTHYRFDQPSTARHKGVGRDFVDGLILNAWIPLLFEYGQRHDDDGCRQQALDLLQQLPAEKNRVSRIWHSVSVDAENAAQSQALLQLYNEYCQQHRCLQCPLGYYVLTAADVADVSPSV